MNFSILIPEKINVGFQSREDTYTKKLAYIIYYDHKGVLRKEASWNSWRDEKIENVIHENVPTSGFVLNKKAGGYSSGWNHRQTYVRVYDPRGFEFEIDVTNLLYILENTNSIKGKGLEGEFVYGWDGKELILIPTDAPDYKEISAYNKIIQEKTYIKGKELKVGARYLTKNNEEYVYLGKFDEYDWDGTKKKGKSFYFYTDRKYSQIETMRALGEKIISVVEEECAENYAELFEILERNRYYSPIDKTKDEYVDYTKEELEEAIAQRRWGKSLYIKNKEKRDVRYSDGIYSYRFENPKYAPSYGWGRNHSSEPYYIDVEFSSLDDLIKELKPTYLRTYLANGKLYSEDK